MFRSLVLVVPLLVREQLNAMLQGAVPEYFKYSTPQRYEESGLGVDSRNQTAVESRESRQEDRWTAQNCIA